MWLSWARLCFGFFVVIIVCGELEAASTHRKSKKTERKCGYDVSDIWLLK